MVCDILFINAATFISLIFRFDDNIPARYLLSFANALIITNIAKLLIYEYFGLYRSLWKYASIRELVCIFYAVSLGALAEYLICLILQSALPRSVHLMSFMLTLLLVGGIRFRYRISKRYQLSTSNPDSKSARAMIIGAGKAGSMLVSEIQSNGNICCTPVLVIDDDHYKHKSNIHGIPVLGGRGQIEHLAKKYSIDEIILAIPSLSNKSKTAILNICMKTNCKIKIFHGINGTINESSTTNILKSVNIEDLLQRDEVSLDLSGISEYLKNEVVLVTGGGGSIGSGICRQVAAFSPKKLLILDIYENNAYELSNELTQLYGNKLDFEVLIASIRDEERIEEIFCIYEPSIIFHAAAHKHVPLMESNIHEALKNNVVGTLNVVRSADKHCAKSFVLISSDKAVNPTSVMGATKRIAEMIIQASAKKSKTEFIAVRFGNVLQSNGSVVPLFKKQIENGGPITITDPRMTRYFMTIKEAVQLVIQAGSMAKGGEIFVLDMGEPIKIEDLARDMIRLSGYVLDEDIKIEYVGLRPGEKLFEELLLNENSVERTAHKKIFVEKPFDISDEQLSMYIDELKDNINDTTVLKHKLFELANKREDGVKLL